VKTATLLNKAPQTNRSNYSFALFSVRGIRWVQVVHVSGAVGKEDSFLGYSNDTLAQREPVDAAKWGVVNNYLVRRARCGVEELEYDSDKARFAATGTAAYSHLLARIDCEVNVTEGEFPRGFIVPVILFATMKVSIF
jgi:hypothetical protein